jgi:hypothetical protein
MQPWQAPWRAANMNTTVTPSSSAGPVGWTPTAVNLLVLVGLEIVIYVALRYTFRIVHGG